MKKVTAIGGIFFRSNDPAAMRQWYRSHLGIEADENGTSFPWRAMDDPAKVGQTVWSTFPQDTRYFGPAGKSFMVNYIVHDLEKLLEELKREGVPAVKPMESHEYGKFGWIADPEGNWIELWEPPDERVPLG